MRNEKRRVLFIDSATLEEIDTALSKGFKGVTTNPSLIAKVPKGESDKSFIERYMEHMNSIANICRKYPDRYGKYPSLSVEVFSNDPDEMIKQAKEMRKKIPYINLAIKVPISYKGQDYLKVIRMLSMDGIDVNCTCGFSTGQLELAAQAGARYISLFYNRLIDYFNSLPNSDGDGKEKSLQIIRNLRKYLDENSELNCEIIQGSIRKGFDVVEGWESGADIVTAGLKIIPEMTQHSGTDASVEGFLKDLEGWMK